MQGASVVLAACLRLARSAFELIYYIYRQPPADSAPATCKGTDRTARTLSMLHTAAHCQTELKERPTQTELGLQAGPLPLAGAPAAAAAGIAGKHLRQLCGALNHAGRARRPCRLPCGPRPRTAAPRRLAAPRRGPCARAPGLRLRRVRAPVRRAAHAGRRDKALRRAAGGAQGRRSWPCGDRPRMASPRRRLTRPGAVALQPLPLPRDCAWAAARRLHSAQRRDRPRARRGRAAGRAAMAARAGEAELVKARRAARAAAARRAAGRGARPAGGAPDPVRVRALCQGRRAGSAQARELGMHASPRIQASCRADCTARMTLACQWRTGLPLVRVSVLQTGSPSACIIAHASGLVCDVLLWHAACKCACTLWQITVAASQGARRHGRAATCAVCRPA